MEQRSGLSVDMPNAHPDFDAFELSQHTVSAGDLLLGLPEDQHYRRVCLWGL